MWIPFFSKSEESALSNSIEDSLPADIKNILEEHEPTISEREFQRKLQTTTNVSNLAAAPSVKDIVETPNATEMLENMQSFQKIESQSTEKLSLQQLKEKSELEDYRRQNPILDAVLENCSEIQKNFFDCLTNGSFKDRLTICNDKQNFHQACIKKQLMIFRMFDYESMDKIIQLDEIRGTADVVFNKYYKNYAELDDDEKNKLFGKELRARREKFYQKHNK